jgi:hypothetical protein
MVSGGRLSCPSCGTMVATGSGASQAPKSPPARTSASRPQPGPTGPSPAPSAEIVGPAPANAFGQAPVPEPPLIRPSRTGSILSQLEARRPSSLPDVAPSVRPISPPIPGAYLAPSAAFVAPTPGARPVRVDESSFLRSTGGYTASAAAAPAPVALAPALATPAATSAPPAATPVAASSARAAISVSVPIELPGWLAIAGSAIAAVSFLMPWSRDGVIGAVGSGYFDRWGLANPGYLPLALIAVALLVLNGVPNPIPAWIRAGIAPLLVGGVLFGLDWAYQTRPYSDGLGVSLLLVGALVLIVGGILGVRPARHQAPPPLV